MITSIATKIACSHGALESRVQSVIDMAETARKLAYEINCLDFGGTAFQSDAYGDASNCAIKLIRALFQLMGKDNELANDIAYDIYMQCIDSNESVAYNLEYWMENNK